MAAPDTAAFTLRFFNLVGLRNRRLSERCCSEAVKVGEMNLSGLFSFLLTARGCGDNRKHSQVLMKNKGRILNRFQRQIVCFAIEVGVRHRRVFNVLLTDVLENR